MTVIAFDGTTIVADGRATRSGSELVSDTYRKLHNINIPKLGKCIVGVTGNLDAMGPFLEHLKINGLAPMENPTGDEEWFMRGLLVTSKGVCYDISSEGGWHIVYGPTAQGSGSTIANHYLVLGFSALEAVKQTCKTELSCGGQILTCDVKKGLIEVYSPV